MSERFIDGANYLAVTDGSGLLLAHVDLNTGEIIQKGDTLVSVNFGEEPHFREIEGDVYLTSVLEELANENTK